jgi:hypothetical protein
VAARIEAQIAGKHVVLSRPEGESRPTPAPAPAAAVWDVSIEGREGDRDELLLLLEADQDPRHDYIREIVGATRK